MKTISLTRYQSHMINEIENERCAFETNEVYHRIDRLIERMQRDEQIESLADMVNMFADDYG